MPRGSCVKQWVVEYLYDPWGKQLSCTGTMATTLGTDNPFRYRSYQYDQEAGLYFLRTRYYNPNIGRFLNLDDTLNNVGSLFGHSIFAYCANNPVGYCDPDGNIKQSVFRREWFIREDSPHYNGGQRHLHVTRGAEEYVQKENGEPSHTGRTTGDVPPQDVIKHILEKHKWDWKKKYKEWKKREEKEKAGEKPEKDANHEDEGKEKQNSNISYGVTNETIMDDVVFVGVSLLAAAIITIMLWGGGSSEHEPALIH